jgi:hypothetical protein
MIATRLLLSILSAVAVSFLGGVLYLWFVPDATPKELWQLVIPLFLPALFAPNFLSGLLKRRK